MIDGTNADCRVKSIKISGRYAYITCEIFSLSAASEQKPFRFYLIKEYDGDGQQSELVPADENAYWIDYANNYENDVSNVDVNQYREVLLKVDISQDGEGDMIGNRWLWNTKLVLVNAKETARIGHYAWRKDIQLLSEGFEIPELRDLRLLTDANGVTTLSFVYEYESQDDFNYNNDNVRTTVEVLDINSGQALETHEILFEDAKSSSVSLELSGKYDHIIQVTLALRNAKGELLKSWKAYHDASEATLGTVYVKTSDGVKPAIGIYIKDDRSLDAESGTMELDKWVSSTLANRDNIEEA